MGFGGPLLQIGRGDTAGVRGGTGALTISNGGLVELVGVSSFVDLGSRAVAPGGAALGGTLDILSGGQFVVDGSAGGAFVTVGHRAGTTGDVVVDGIGSSLSVTSGLEAFHAIGDEGAGTLGITGGASASFANATLNVGLSAGSTGALNLAGASSLTVGNALHIGFEGTGTLNLAGGSLVTTADLQFGAAGGGSGVGTVTGAGSTINVAGFFAVGQGFGGSTPGAAATGTLNILAGGTVNAGGGLQIGGEANATGGVTVSGLNSRRWSSCRRR